MKNKLTVASLIVGIAVGAIGTTLVQKRSRASNSSSGCPIDETKRKFLAECSTYLGYQDMSASREPNHEKNREICRCVSLNFSVQNTVDPPGCDFTSEVMNIIMKKDSVVLRCR
ncbi:MAG: hypothetical protein AB7F43_07705 [Bacteriovoracia bacterium]